MPVDRMVRLSRAGDRDALARLCEHFYPLLRRFFRRLGASAADADDLSQDTLLRMMENLHTFYFLPGHSFDGWLFRIAYNLYIDAVRRKKMLPIPDAFPAASPDPTPEQIALKKEAANELKQAIGSLDGELQAMLALRYEMDMSYFQIAQAMNITPTRVKWRLNEAKGKLRGLLNDPKKRGVPNDR